MAEIRRDPLSGRWVIFSTGEGFTSRDFLLRREGGFEPGPCPFDEGREEMTPPELFALREAGTAPDTPGWKIRVVPDRQPILIPGAVGPHDSTPTRQTRPGEGHHEIVILTPEHDRDLAEMTPAEIADGLKVLRDRYAKLAAIEGMEHVVLMINHGREAGASLSHAHAQLFAIPFIPEDLEDELEHCESYLKETGSCLVCKEISQELEEGTRIAGRTDNVVAYLPFASRLPFQMSVAPIFHGARFEAVSDEALEELASLLSQVLTALSDKLDDPPYNLVFRSSPVNVASDLYFHWYIDVLTRQLFAANFELVSDVWVNSVTPEVAARILREEPEPR